MKTTPNLLDRLVGDLLPAFVEAKRSEPLFLELARKALEETLELYRPKSDDFKGERSESSARWRGTRAPDAPKIRIRFYQLGLSQGDLARRLGISPAAASKALNRERWTFERFERWAQVLGCRVDEIVLVGDDTRASGVL